MAEKFSAAILQMAFAIGKMTFKNNISLEGTFHAIMN